jgi:hypothetical protein
LAIQRLSKLMGKLGKPHIGYIFSDKQFGMSSKDCDIKLFFDGRGVKLTSLQKQQVIKI